MKENAWRSGFNADGSPVAHGVTVPEAPSTPNLHVTRLLTQLKTVTAKYDDERTFFHASSTDLRGEFYDAGERVHHEIMTTIIDSAQALIDEVESTHTMERANG